MLWSPAASSNQQRARVLAPVKAPPRTLVLARLALGETQTIESPPPVSLLRPEARRAQDLDTHQRFGGPARLAARVFRKVINHRGTVIVGVLMTAYARSSTYVRPTQAGSPAWRNPDPAGVGREPSGIWRPQNLAAVDARGHPGGSLQRRPADARDSKAPSGAGDDDDCVPVAPSKVMCHCMFGVARTHRRPARTPW